MVYLRRMSSEHMTDRCKKHGSMCQSIRKITKLMEYGEVDLIGMIRKGFIPGWCGI